MEPWLILVIIKLANAANDKILVNIVVMHIYLMLAGIETYLMMALIKFRLILPTIETLLIWAGTELS